MGHQKYKFDPDYAVRPGSVLEEHLEARCLSQAEFARRCGRSPKLISEIISGKAPIEPKTAIQFENVLGLKAYAWLELETKYRLHEARRTVTDALERDVCWSKEFPIKELVKRGYLAKNKTGADTVVELLSFFGVATRHAWEERYSVQDIKFRKSKARTDGYAIKTWLRIGELGAESLNCGEYDERQFKSAITRIRNLTAEPFDSALKDTVRLCCDAGVALIITPPFKNTGIHGVARWISGKKPTIQLSARHLCADQLWFSFFHEAAHLILHAKNRLFVDGSGTEKTTEEREANKFASDLLINRQDWTNFISSDPISRTSVKAFSRQQKIAPGIVVGRLQHEKIIPHSHLNDLKVRLEWTSDNTSP